MAKTPYVDNKLFLVEMTNYYEARKEAEACGEEPPRINNYIGTCIYDIANRLSHKPNFINYPFREEMVGDGIENAIKFIGNFDPSKSSNPFAYFTQVIYFAFLRRIQKEKKALYIKHKVMEKNIIDTSLVDTGPEATLSAIPTEYMNDFVKNFEESMEAKKKVVEEKKKKGVEKFCEDKA